MGVRRAGERMGDVSEEFELPDTSGGGSLRPNSRRCWGTRPLMGYLIPPQPEPDDHVTDPTKSQSPAPRRILETISYTGDGPAQHSNCRARACHVRRRPPRTIRVAYERRNRDLDPQFTFGAARTSRTRQISSLPAPAALHRREGSPQGADRRPDSPLAGLGGGAGGVPDRPLLRLQRLAEKSADKTEFYKHDANWSNRMVLGDSLQVMASLAEREGMRGKVQCIYLDPPYGIRFNSNFQWSYGRADAVREGNPANTSPVSRSRLRGLPRHLARRRPFLSRLPASTASLSARDLLAEIG